MKVYAHRGDRGEYPENTMLAFKKAVEAGCDGIELDVQLSKDGEVVIFHDETLERTTDGRGFVRDYTLAELKKLDAGKIKEGKYGFCEIPTLQEYCAWVGDFNIVTNVEIKSGVFYYEELEEKTLEIVRRYGLEEKVLCSSFNHMSIHLLKQLSPSLKCGALVEYEDLGNAGYYCKKHGFDCFHPDYRTFLKADMENCKIHGIEVNVWTVNEKEVLRKLYEWGCDGVFSDYPKACKEWIREMETLKE